MKRKWLMRIFLCVAVMLFGVNAFAASVPDTGQTKCYDNTVEIPCPSPGQPFYGQDGNYNINPMSYTKMDSSGNVLPDSATSWVMVKDNVTGLIWELKTNKDGVANYNDPHDADNTYTWYNSSPATNGGDAGTPGNGTDTEDFIKALNDAKYGGFSDWRLPTIKELTYIVNYSIHYPGPTIDTGFFPNTAAPWYWTSTSYANGAGRAWLVDFDYTYDYNYYYPEKSRDIYVRAVRGGQPGSLDNYTDNGDGTVTDTSTGLMWQQVSSSNMTWEQALAHCEDLNLAGYTDWRLPNFKELRSLVDYSRYNPAINTTYFQDTAAMRYWSSTTWPNWTTIVWYVYFSDGTGSNDMKSFNGQSSTAYVRAVRGGQPTKIYPLPIYRFYNTIDGGYLYTIDEAEKNSVIQNYKFRYEGIGFYAFPTKQPGSLPVYRFNTLDGGYFYTINEAEKNSVMQDYKFRYEGIGFYAFPAKQPETLPVYRFNTVDGVYFYTIDEAEKNTVMQDYKWFRYEGIGFYAYPTRTTTPITACTAKIDENLLLNIPYLSYVNPVLKTISLWTDLAYEYNPTYPSLILFRFANFGIINNPSFSCAPSTLSDDFKIHIPDVLFPDGITHLWVDLEYSPALSTDANAFFVITNYGVGSK